MADDELDCSSVFKDEMKDEEDALENDDQEDSGEEDGLLDEEDDDQGEEETKLNFTRNRKSSSSAMSEYMSGNRDLYRFLDVLYNGSAALLEKVKDGLLQAVTSSEAQDQESSGSAEVNREDSPSKLKEDDESFKVNDGEEGTDTPPPHAHLYDNNLYQID